MNSAENFKNLAKAFYNAGGTVKNFAEAVRKAEKAANRPDWPKTYFESKRKKGMNRDSADGKHRKDDFSGRGQVWHPRNQARNGHPH